MDKKVIDMRNIRKARMKAWFREKYEDAKDFADRNKEVLAVAVPVIGGVVTAGIKAISKHAKLHKEQHLKNEYCYDRSLGHYWELRRKLTNSEWVEIDKRKKNGERLSDILDSLKVLK